MNDDHFSDVQREQLDDLASRFGSLEIGESPSAPERTSRYVGLSSDAQHLLERIAQQSSQLPEQERALFIAYVLEASGMSQSGSTSTGALNQNAGNLSGTVAVELVKGNTYASALAALQTACNNDPNNAQPTFTLPNGSTVYRPLTLEESIRKGVEHFNTDISRPMAERLRFIDCIRDTISAVTYKGGTSRFKITPVSPHLLSLPSTFRESSIAVPYDSVQGIELNTSNGIYNQGLTDGQILDNEGWRTVVPDTHLLRAHRDIVKSALTQRNRNTPLEPFMGFYVITQPKTDYQNALFVYWFGGGSYAYGKGSLNCNASVLRVVRRAEK